RPQHARDDVEQRRLPRAVGPDETEHLAAPRVQRDAVEGADATELLGDVLDDERGWLAHVAGSSWAWPEPIAAGAAIVGSLRRPCQDAPPAFTAGGRCRRFRAVAAPAHTHVELLPLQHEPAHRVVADAIRTRLALGELRPGDRLPPERV